jgi:hypothetical protein
VQALFFLGCYNSFYPPPTSAYILATEFDGNILVHNITFPNFSRLQNEADVVLTASAETRDKIIIKSLSHDSGGPTRAEAAQKKLPGEFEMTTTPVNNFFIQIFQKDQNGMLYILSLAVQSTSRVREWSFR